MLSLTPFLFPSSPDLLLEKITCSGQTLFLTVRSSRRTGSCPDCAESAEKVHSQYVRTLADVPLMEYAVRLHVQVRRFFCSNPACGRKTFAEQFPDLTPANARRTHRQIGRLSAIAKELGGRPGARESTNVCIPVSRHTLLRLLNRAPIPPVPVPRVLGGDDWALRRGQTYGTILVDLERHRVVDLLPDRLSETFAAWLQEHPGVEAISRDRAGDFAKGGRLGAPSALQIADRWHVIQNLAHALDPAVRRLGRSLGFSPNTTEKKAPETKSSTPLIRLTPAQHQRREYLRERFGQVQGLYQQGRSLGEIARIVEIDKNTLRYFVQSQPWAGTVAAGRRKPTESSLAPYLPYLHKRWKAGCQNSLQLWRELHTQGYPGSTSSIKPYVAFLRQVPEDLLPATFTRSKKSGPVGAFSVHRLIWLALSRPETLTQKQKRELAQAFALSTQVATALTLAQAFVKMLRDQQVEALPGRLESAQASPIRELRQFAQGIERDRAAVEAALSRPESNGQTEGKVNKLKCLKRQMYGRATFALLRQRMLLCG